MLQRNRGAANLFFIPLFPTDALIDSWRKTTLSLSLGLDARPGTGAWSEKMPSSRRHLLRQDLLRADCWPYMDFIFISFTCAPCGRPSYGFQSGELCRNGRLVHPPICRSIAWGAYADFRQTIWWHCWRNYKSKKRNESINWFFFLGWFIRPWLHTCFLGMMLGSQ